MVLDSINGSNKESINDSNNNKSNNNDKSNNDNKKDLNNNKNPIMVMRLNKLKEVLDKDIFKENKYLKGFSRKRNR